MVPICRMSPFFWYRRQAYQRLSSYIYQLLDHERVLKFGGNDIPTFSDRSSIITAEEEWGRRCSMLDNGPFDADVAEDLDVTEVARKLRALDRALGASWKCRYGGRRRTRPIASKLTSGSILSEDLIEVEEKEELLNVSRGFDDSSQESIATSADPQCEEDRVFGHPLLAPRTARPVQRNLFLALSQFMTFRRCRHPLLGPPSTSLHSIEPD